MGNSIGAFVPQNRYPDECVHPAVYRRLVPLGLINLCGCPSGRPGLLPVPGLRSVTSLQRMSSRTTTSSGPPPFLRLSHRLMTPTKQNDKTRVVKKNIPKRSTGRQPTSTCTAGWGSGTATSRAPGRQDRATHCCPQLGCLVSWHSPSRTSRRPRGSSSRRESRTGWGPSLDRQRAHRSTRGLPLDSTKGSVRGKWQLTSFGVHLWHRHSSARSGARHYG